MKVTLYLKDGKYINIEHSQTINGQELIDEVTLETIRKIFEENRFVSIGDPNTEKSGTIVNSNKIISIEVSEGKNDISNLPRAF